MTALSELVSTLPECYQPIYGFPDLSPSVSRICVDRHKSIKSVYNVLSKKLGRPLRVLDVGCAQGYFSFALAELGAEVVGIDYLDKNIAVCNALADCHSSLKARFIHADAFDFLSNVTDGEYDLILGLSVFHHLCHSLGRDVIADLMTSLSKKINAACFEFALAAEPLYWAKSLHENEEDLIQGFSFRKITGRHSTHLSDVKRPIYVASSRYCIIENNCITIERATNNSHALVSYSHDGTRNYFIGDGLLVKRIDFCGTSERKKYNLDEFQAEVRFLENPPANFVNSPQLRYKEEGNDCGWLIRDLMEGKLLSDLQAASEKYNPTRILSDVLDQLILLEKNSLWHNDVRTWNTLVRKDGSASLIDFGAITSNPIDCVWPKNIWFSFLQYVYEVVTFKTEFILPTRAPCFSPDSFPEPYREWIRVLWSTNLDQWSFLLIKDKFESALAHGKINNKSTSDIDGSWKSLIESYLLSERRSANNRLSTLEKHIKEMNEQGVIILKMQFEQLTRKDDELKAQAESLAHKDSEIARRDDELKAQAESLAHKDSEIVRRDGELKAKIASISNRDAEIAKLRQMNYGVPWHTHFYRGWRRMVGDLHYSQFRCHAFKRYSNLNVPWHTHLYRAGLGLFVKGEKPWHTHVYRAWKSLIGDARYAPRLIS